MQKALFTFLATIAMIAATSSGAAPLSTSITYQGNLSDNGALADGDFDFEFELFDAPTMGAQIGSTVSLDDVPVATGIFTVDLDFGAAPFTGDDMWLLIRVRDGASTGAHTELLPRQALTPAPFALHAEFVPAGSITDTEIDTASVQARVSTSCVVGRYIRAIDAAGNVTCEADADTVTTAGAGLNLAGNVMSVDTNTTQTRITGLCPANQSIQSVDAAGNVTCETDDDTTYTVGAGLNLIGTVVSVDATTTQARVTGSCPVGESIRTIDTAGNVACEIDTNTTYTVGTGLSLVGTEMSVNSSALQLRITGTCPAGQSIQTIDASGNVTCEADDVGLTSVTSADIDDGVVGSVDIDSSQVQERVFGNCATGTYLSGINQNGSVVCSVVPVGLARSLDSGFVGSSASIAIRQNGLPIISYYDFAFKDLKAFDCGNAACSIGTARILESAGSVGLDTSIAIRDDGLPIISYYDFSFNDLKAFDCSNVACSSGTVRILDSVGNVGAGSSIAIRDDGLPIISYSDSTNGGMKAFDCSNTSCSSGTARTLDSSAIVAIDTSVAIRDNGLPIISYYDFSFKDLKAFDCSNVACSSGTVRILDSVGNVGADSSIAIRDDGLPIISYADYSNGDLKVFDCSDSACTSGTASILDSPATVGSYTSIAIRDNGLPMISYHDNSNSDLKLFDCHDTSCTSGTVLRPVSSGDVGRFTSIAIRDDGLPIISFYDNTFGHLRVYSCGDSRCEN